MGNLQRQQRSLAKRFNILDATRTLYGVYVVFRVISKSIHLYEVEIGQFLSSELSRSDPTNHYVPIYDAICSVWRGQGHNSYAVVLSTQIAMIWHHKEVVECFRQLSEVSCLVSLIQIFMNHQGLQFTYKHRIVHRHVFNHPLHCCLKLSEGIAQP